MEQSAELREKLKEVLESKRDEFHLLGYESVTTEDIWACVTSRYGETWPALHQLVNDIFSLKVTDFMNWLTVGAYRGTIDFDKNTFI